MKKKNILFYFVLSVIIIFSSCASYGMDNLPKGELMQTVYSPDETYIINSYLVSGGATVDFCVRCEVVEIPTGKKRNIYWEYRCETARIEWINNTTVKINDKLLNVNTDSYDWRK